MSLAELLEAERELGRLDQLLGGDRRDLWLDDAIRRETVASFGIEGEAVSWEELAVAHVDVLLLPVEQRNGILAPLDLARAAKSMQKMFATAAPQPTANGKAAIAELLASIRQAKADIEDFVGNGAAGAPAPAAESAQPGRQLLQPLTGPWLAAAWRRAHGENPPEAQMAGVAAEIAEHLEQPGLVGLADALFALHQPGALPDPDIQGTSRPLQRRAPGQHDPRGWRFARLITPWLMQTACRLNAPGPWLSAVFRRARHGYLAATTSSERWRAWLYPTLTDSFLLERRRIAEVGDLVDRWEARFGSTRNWRWAASRQNLLLLLAYPAVTTKFLCQERAFTRRAAQQLAKDLETANIVQRIHHAKGQEWFIAPELQI